LPAELRGPPRAPLKIEILLSGVLMYKASWRMFEAFTDAALIDIPFLRS
jgi:hypothetical protein